MRVAPSRRSPDEGRCSGWPRLAPVSCSAWLGGAFAEEPFEALKQTNVGLIGER